MYWSCSLSLTLFVELQSFQKTMYSEKERDRKRRRQSDSSSEEDKRARRERKHRRRSVSSSGDERTTKKTRKARRRSASRSDEEKSARRKSEPFNFDRHKTKLTKMFFRPIDLIKEEGDKSCAFDDILKNLI